VVPHGSAGGSLLQAKRASHVSSSPPRFIPPSTREVYEKVLESATDPRSQWNSGAVQWSPTVLTLYSDFFIAEKRIQCGRKHAGSIRGACNYNIDMVLKRKDTGNGQVVYARSTVRDAEPEPGCAEFALCLADARMDEMVPLPPGDDDLVALQQRLQSSPLPPYMKDRTHIQKLIAYMKQANESLRRSSEPGDAKSSHALAKQEDVVRYLENKLTEMN
jgi:hypothetical protein